MGQENDRFRELAQKLSSQQSQESYPSLLVFTLLFPSFLQRHILSSQNIGLIFWSEVFNNNNPQESPHGITAMAQQRTELKATFVVSDIHLRSQLWNNCRSRLTSVGCIPCYPFFLIAKF